MTITGRCVLDADPLIRTEDDFTALDMAATFECLELLRPR
ncbi:hypothetical protein FHX59_006731 [Paraburkholderia silvatlantica]|uniref:Uncharacterized protein n=1 Tax=Paraburkholderia silvatlantica TaxID=321895 RepID=A0ABR6FZS0_9BURK|nr:hypothetical protein [Paraburkholderia silvatlantica]PVY23284.1 hypothetical protein C7411_13067 [Paraburkholderia silvatlantica]PXW29843.1 hypothetical protein C7413_13067 [Paraburkholderia silvatlantica]